MQIGQAAQLQSLDYLASNISRRMFERSDGVALLFVGALHTHKHARMLHIRLYAYFAHYHAAFEPRIFQLSRQHGVDLVRDLLAHALMSMIRGGHFSSQRPRRVQISRRASLKLSQIFARSETIPVFRPPCPTPSATFRARASLRSTA